MIRAGLQVAASLASCVFLLAASLAGGVPRWATALAGCGFTAGAQVPATRLERGRSLHDDAAMPRTDPDADPPWWPEFGTEVRRTTTQLDSSRNDGA